MVDLEGGQQVVQEKIATIALLSGSLSLRPDPLQGLAELPLA